MLPNQRRAPSRPQVMSPTTQEPWATSGTGMKAPGVGAGTERRAGRPSTQTASLSPAGQEASARGRASSSSQTTWRRSRSVRSAPPAGRGTRRTPSSPARIGRGDGLHRARPTGGVDAEGDDPGRIGRAHARDEGAAARALARVQAGAQGRRRELGERRGPARGVDGRDAKRAPCEIDREAALDAAHEHGRVGMAGDALRGAEAGPQANGLAPGEPPRRADAGRAAAVGREIRRAEDAGLDRAPGHGGARNLGVGTDPHDAAAREGHALAVARERAPRDARAAGGEGGGLVAGDAVGAGRGAQRRAVEPVGAIARPREEARVAPRLAERAAGRVGEHALEGRELRGSGGRREAVGGGGAQGRRRGEAGELREHAEGLAPARGVEVDEHGRGGVAGEARGPVVARAGRTRGRRRRRPRGSRSRGCRRRGARRP